MGVNKARIARRFYGERAIKAKSRALKGPVSVGVREKKPGLEGPACNEKSREALVAISARKIRGDT
jgi:hypothetical protein